MWLNPQSWAVISGLADEKQADCALQQVYDRLNTEYGAILMDPPYHEHAFDGALAVIYNAGTKENAPVLFAVAGLDHFSGSIKRTWGEGIYLFYGERSGSAE